MSIASTSRRAQAWTHARAELVRLGVPSEAWPRHTTPHLMYTYWLHSPLDWLPRIVVLLTVQRFEIPSQDLGTEHSVCFPFGDDAHAAWEACKRRAGWQPSLPRPQSRVAAALQGPLLPHSGNADAPPSDTIALTPAALAEAAAASGARLTKAAAASGARQPAAQDEEMLIMMREWTPMKHNDPQWRMLWAREQDPQWRDDIEFLWAEAVAQTNEEDQEEINPFLPFEAAVADAKLEADTKQRRVLERWLLLIKIGVLELPEAKR